MKTKTLKTTILILAAAAYAGAQQAPAPPAPAPERTVVPLRDPARPAKLRVNLLNGSITVKTHADKNMVVESATRAGARHRSRAESVDGLRRIDSTGFDLTIEEDNNTVRVGGDVTRNLDLTVLVPVNTSVTATTVNGGIVSIDGVTGEVEANNTNGPVTVTNISGSVIAHSLNGRVKVVLDRITANKEMSFSTLNGDIDVTLPVDTKANVKLKTDNGDIFSDFDIKMDMRSASSVEDNRGQGGKYKIKVEKTMFGAMNGGGPLFSFTTLNGRILIRQKK